MEIHFGKTLISNKNVVSGRVFSFFERLLELHLDKIGFESQIMHLACRSLKSQKSSAIFCPKLQLYNESLMVGLINTLKHEFLKNGQAQCVNAASPHAAPLFPICLVLGTSSLDELNQAWSPTIPLPRLSDVARVLKLSSLGLRT